MTVSIDRDWFVNAMKHQSKIGDHPQGGLHRLALSDEDKAVRDWLFTEMESLGLDVRVDAFGNMFGRRPGNKPGASPVLLGSHLDSQPAGGRFDGALGVIAALGTVRGLNEEGVETRRPIEIVNWTNEEGSRFQPAMQGSGVWTGQLDIETEYEKTDTEGLVLEDELERIGYKGTLPAEPNGDYHSYLELHIEQGPILDCRNKDIGVVTGVVGFSWGHLSFQGEADHSGTTPFYARKDSLVAAADMITQLRRIAMDLGEQTVGTVGFVDVSPNTINTIPESTTISWDLRDPNDSVIDDAYERIRTEAETIASREGVSWTEEERMRVRSVEFSPQCITAIESAAKTLGYEPLRIVSGAGHDASHLANLCDTGMVFAVSENGKSHAVEEYTSWEDCLKSANTLSVAAFNLAQTT